jgi:ferredoxin
MALYNVEIDRSLCAGYGICVELAPGVIELDDRAEATLRTAETDDAAVVAAAAECPMGAIRVVRGDSDRRGASSRGC